MGFPTPALIQTSGDSIRRLQLVASNGPESVNSRRKRLTARQIPLSVRYLIVSYFDRLESHDAVADQLRPELPNITGKTVAEVLDLHAMRKISSIDRTIQQHLRRSA